MWKRVGLALLIAALGTEQGLAKQGGWVIPPGRENQYEADLSLCIAAWLGMLPFLLHSEFGPCMVNKGWTWEGPRPYVNLAFPDITFEQPTDHSRLLKVKRIYIAAFSSSEEGTNPFHKKLRAKLIKSGRFEVVEKPEDADAILEGDARNTGVVGGVHYDMVLPPDKGLVAMLKLIGSSSRKHIWGFEYKGRFTWGGGARKIARKTVKQLLNDIEIAEQHVTSGDEEADASLLDVAQPIEAQDR